MTTGQTVTYHVRPKANKTSYYEIECHFTYQDTDNALKLSLPNWIPGSYCIRDYAKFLSCLIVKCDGKPLLCKKVSKSEWQCEQAVGEITLTYEIYAWDQSVRGAYIDDTFAFLNSTCTFLNPSISKDCQYQIHIALPECHQDWKIVAALPTIKTDHSAAFTAKDYNTLVDSPIIMGQLQSATFDVSGIEHNFYIFGQAYDFDFERLVNDTKTLCEHHHQLFEHPISDAPYHFYLNTTEKAYGGLEHLHSTLLMCPRACLSSFAQTNNNSEYQTLLELISHEYFHRWYVKSLRSIDFAVFDLQKENYTDDLWIFEGFTSYFDALSLRTTQLITPEQYLQNLSKVITRLLKTSGRHKQSLAQSSYDAWIKLYQLKETLANDSVSYYTKGAVVSCMLDILLRVGSSGKINLQMLVKDLWQAHHAEGLLPKGAVFNWLEKHQLVEAHKFLTTAVFSTDELPIQETLQSIGLTVNFRKPNSLKEMGTKAQNEVSSYVDLGFNYKVDTNLPVLGVVHANGIAEAAGLKVRDELVALDGFKVTQANTESLVMQLSGKQSSVKCCYFREGYIGEVELDLTQKTESFVCELGINKNVNKEQEMLLNQWLNEKT